MKKYNKLVLLIGALLSAEFAIAENVIIWETLGNDRDMEGRTFYTQRFTIVADEPYDGVAFCMMKRGMQVVNPQDEFVEILPGYFMVRSPRFQNVNPGDTTVVDVLTWGVLQNHYFFPDGMHLVKDEKPVAASNIRKRITSVPKQWLDIENDSDAMVYGDMAYRFNEKVKSDYTTPPYGQIPTLKSVKLLSQKLNIKNLKDVDFTLEPIADKRIDYWTAEVMPEKILIKTNSNNPKVIIDNLQRRLVESADEDGFVAAAVIEDWADYAYRGFMLDVARNFLGKDDVKQVLDIMHRYGLNVLHFHLGEDEAWRMEIPSIPELTMIGGHRGYTLSDDESFLKGIYSGDGNPDSPTVANGFYTVDDYIDILQYANSKGIDVIPEFDTPGHSRAAIRAMEWRYKHSGDSTLRLIHDGDTSVYTTAQEFHDNIMNPAIDGPYKFWSVLFDDVIDIYRKAGVPLRAIHIGGDEVARNAWNGSDKAQNLMKQMGMTDQRELHAYFVQRIAKIAEEKGVKIAGWEEIAMNHPESYDVEVRPVVEAVNSWTYAGKQGPEMLDKGYNIILSNVDYLYFDQHHSSHPEEPGLSWGGIIDEFVPLHATVETLIDADSIVQSKVYGISAQLFGETIRDFGMVQRYILPRILGLSERAHNTHATIDDNEYFGMITEEMPRWANEGLQFFVRQPGIIVEDGLVKMNNAYGFGEIRYTIDGTEPTHESDLYTEPFSVGDIKEIRAKLFVAPTSWSVTSILYR